MGLTLNNHEISTSLDEITISKFKELLLVTLDNTLDNIDKQIKTISVLSDGALTVEMIEDLDIEVFNSINSKLTLDITDSPIREFINIDDKLFKLKGSSNDFSFKLKDILAIRDTIQTDFANYLPVMMSRVYINDDVSKAESAKLFNLYMTMDYVSPFLNVLQKTYGTK